MAAPVQSPTEWYDHRPSRIQFHEEVDIDPDSIFDIQIKRLHEYKRQLMMAFYIADLYNRIKADPDGEWTKRTFIFGAKAAPGYYIAKAIIKYIKNRFPLQGKKLQAQAI